MPAKKTKMRVGKYSVDVTNTDKVLFSDDGITKGDLIEYYRRVAEFMIPHIRHRPLNMQRFPNGIRGEEFYQQAMPESLPGWITRVTVEKDKGRLTHLICDNAATLVYLANLACITPHVWLSRADKPHIPDLMIFDLDPPGDDFEPSRSGALSLKGLLEELGLRCFVKTTGSHGLHVVVSLNGLEDFDSVRATAHGIAGVMAKREPRRFTVEQRKDKRQGRLFIDTLRNAYAQTAVAPYAVRARDGAPVASPLNWEELNDPKLTSRSYTLRNIFERLAKVGDPWKDLESQSQPLAKARKRLAVLIKELGGS